MSVLQNVSKFEHFWHNVLDKTSEVGLEEPILPGDEKHQIVLKLEGSSHYHSTVIDYYRAQYFEVIDLIVGCIKDSFDQPGYKVYCKSEKLMLNTSNKHNSDSEFDEMVSLYGSDFNPLLLKTWLQVLSTKFVPPVFFSAVKKFLIDLGKV